jgi:hypothetical protein
MKKKKSPSKNTMSIIVITSLTILTALIIVSGLYAHKLLCDDSVKLVNEIDDIIQSSRSGDWERSADKVRQMDIEWKIIKRTWSSLIDHQEIDNIDVTLSRLQILIETRDIPSLMPEAAALRKIISHIPEKESLSIDNLF